MEQELKQETVIQRSNYEKNREARSPTSALSKGPTGRARDRWAVHGGLISDFTDKGRLRWQQEIAAAHGEVGRGGDAISQEGASVGSSPREEQIKATDIIFPRRVVTFLYARDSELECSANQRDAGDRKAHVIGSVIPW